MSEKKNFTWHCRRIGGTDHVTLKTMTELRHLSELDPKLWAALSCPTAGLEFDQRTLTLLDTDADGRIRMPEVLEAAEWLAARLKDFADITGRPESMPLAAINIDIDEGRRLLATARSVLAGRGRPDAEELTREDVTEAMAAAAGQTFNGDGIMPPASELDDEMRAFIEAGLAIVGGARDAGGEPGLNSGLADSLMHELELWQAWQKSVDAAPHPVADTSGAWRLLASIRTKVDDFFLRAGLAAFAPESEDALNCGENLQMATGPAGIDSEMVNALPLARVTADANLPLASGLNPQWQDQVRAFAELVQPLLGDTSYLTRADWKNVQEALAPFGEALAARPAVTAYEEGRFAPPEDAAGALDALGAAGVEKFLTSGVAERFKALAAQDLESAAATEAVAALERLVLYYLHLHRLLMNFVSFHDFYSLHPDVVFLAGTLYLDGRSCRLCVPVAEVDKHARLAGMSQMCLLYCECTRRGAVEAEKRLIMAAMTAGSDDVLVVGRNGVFVDNTGQDWDATLVHVAHNPISLRQAVWAPYKRASQMIGTQLAKFTAAKDAAVLDKTQGAIDAAVAPQPAAPAFDIGKSVGILAAIGLALGAIGTAIGSIAQALLALKWWQFPLLILGIFVLISGSSVFLAWLKLRKRVLGPVLEASGWAVNTQLPINLKLGNILTGIATPPGNIERQDALDPLHEKRAGHGCFILCLLILLAALALGSWLWQTGKVSRLARYFSPFQHQAAVEKVETTEKAQAPARPNTTKPISLEKKSKVGHEAKIVPKPASPAREKEKKPEAAPAPPPKEKSNQDAGAPSILPKDSGNTPEQAPAAKEEGK